MKFPDVSKLGNVTIPDAGRFVILMVNEDWEPDDADHDSDHAVGRCECHCRPPLDALLEAAEAGL